VAVGVVGIVLTLGAGPVPAASGAAAPAVVAPGVVAPAVVAPGGARVLYRIADDRITEASGIAPGLVSPDVDYVENDSGDVNRFFALDARTGATAATITVPGARNVDWEDIAVAPDAAGTPSVWLADIGDNNAVRDEVQIYRVDEPHVSASGRDLAIQAPKAEVWRLRYPGGPINAESFAVAPDGTGYIVTKSYLGASTVYRIPPRSDPDRVQLLRRVGSIGFGPTGTPNPYGLPGELTATSAAISRDGTVLAVRTYSDAYVWRLGRAGVGAALQHPPTRFALPDQPAGEGIAVTGADLLLDSEGQHSAVYAEPIRPTRPTTRSSVPTRARVPSAAAATPAPGPRTGADDRSGWVYGGVAGSAVILVLVGWRLRRRRHPAQPS
jgi:hypothetical protein